MLSPEDRARIEREERQKVEEERYRAEVRSRYQGEETQQASPATARSGGFPLGWILVVAVVAAAVFLFSSSARETKRSDSAKIATPVSPAAMPIVRQPVVRFIPEQMPIYHGQLIVKAGQYVYQRFEVTAAMVDAQLRGRFSVTGGSQNDIEGALFNNEDDMRNFVNGHRAMVRWSTQGKRSAGTIEANLRPGVYTLVFSNRMSTFSEKQLFLDADLHHSRRVVE